MSAGTVLCILGLVLSGCVSTQKYMDAQSEVEALGMDKDKLAAQNADLEALLAGARTENDTLADQVVALTSKVEAAEGNTSTLRSQLEQRDNQIKTLNATINRLNTEIEAITRENEELRGKIVPPEARPE
jgi:outer membrane murein-binding lipoprotein Lpp